MNPVLLHFYGIALSIAPMESSVIVEEYRPEHRNEWEAFVQNSNNGTMFHRLCFLDYHPPGKFHFHHLLFRKNGALVGVMPGGLMDNGRILWSPVGASYGGIVTGDIPFALALEIVDALLAYGRRIGLRELYLIPPPFIYSRNYSQNLEYALLYRRFGFEYHYISHAIHLKHGASFLRFFDKTARKTIRKLLRQASLRVEESQDYETFYRILVQNKARHGAKPTHSLEDLYRLQQLVPEHLRLLMVYYNQTPIAGSLLFLCNPKVVLCFYNMMLYEYQHLRPIYLLMYEIVRWATEQGYEWVDIGVSQDTKSPNPMTPALSLIHFKERFDSRGILRSTFYYRFL